MLYLISVLAVAAGAVVLLTMLVRLSASARRFAETVGESRAHVAHRTRALAMRIAELRLAVNQRLHRNGDGSHHTAAA
ncbi:MAG TPA: hypothetical protein VFA63_09030 [Pseudonocardiaceae bacterium]|nr:hypothetical protein [Pseudonocardiaceae bacterium]